MPVIMEWLNDRDAYYYFRFTLLPANFLDDVRSSIQVLHKSESGLVFGDLRRPNHEGGRLRMGWASDLRLANDSLGCGSRAAYNHEKGT